MTCVQDILKRHYAYPSVNGQWKGKHLKELGILP
jgi:hypothetical protein